MDPFIHNLSCVMICKGTLFYWYSEVTILHVWAFLTFGLWVSLLITFNYYQKKQKQKTKQNKKRRYIIQPYRLKLNVPFPQCIYKVLEITGIATIIKSYLRGMSIISLGFLCAVQRSVLYVMLRGVSSCSVVFLYSLSATFCCQCFSLRGFVPPLE